MRKICFYILYLGYTTLFSQTAFQNFGNIQMHTDASIGFHTHLVNDGDFDNNLGFTGFYSTTETLTVSGDNRTIFNNVEVDVVNNLELNTSMGVATDLIFMNGKVITPRQNLGVSLDFINHDAYVGEDDLRHVDGYTSIEGSPQFTFPIGDNDRLRPMITSPEDRESYYLGAYFFEDPNTPNTFATTFATTEKHYEIDAISTYEFWDLNGTDVTTVTLTWDTLSNVSSISPNLDDLIIVGWNTNREKWESLGNTSMTGDFNNGTITSIAFSPNQFEIITLGSATEISNNYYISPNGDEIGDTLVFTELDEFPLSKLVVFNRWGNLVFTSDNYQNNFDGTSQGRATFQKNKELPVGTYFYELYFGEEDLTEFKKGWVYISR